MPRLAWVLLAVLSLLWGGSFLSARIAAPEIPPFTLVLVRVAIAAAALNVYLAASGRRLPLDRRSVAEFAGMGFLNNIIPFSLIFYGTATISAGLASILNATTPILTALVFHVLTRDEKLTPNRTAGVLVGFAGVAVMLGPSALGDLGGHLLAELACVGASLGYAFSTLFARRFRGRDPATTAAGQLTAASMIALPIALVVDRPWTLPLPSAEVVAAVLFLALFATAFAYVLFFRILTLAGSNVQLVTFLVPATAVLLGWLILGEELDARGWAGMALIMAGLAAIDGRILKRLRPARA